jgi:chlorinating enzyme
LNLATAHPLVRWAVLCNVMALTRLKPLHPLLPTRVRDKLLVGWDGEMYRTALRHFGKKLFLDMPCELPDPPSWAPKTEVAPEHRFTEEEIRRFYRDGFLGPELLVWRSQFFNKPPGAPAITWHAASVYLSEAFNEPVLRPRNMNELFQVTTWVAVDDVDLENGCMQFIPGTHRRFLPAVFRSGVKQEDKNGKFVGMAVGPDHPKCHDFPIPRELHESGEVVPMPLEAGQCVMFSERTLHGSGPNDSPTRRRMGITVRTIRPDVEVYGDKRFHNVTYLNSKFDLANWAAVVLRGDPSTPNRLKPAPVA